MSFPSCHSSIGTKKTKKEIADSALGSDCTANGAALTCLLRTACLNWHWHVALPTMKHAASWGSNPALGVFFFPYLIFHFCWLFIKATFRQECSRICAPYWQGMFAESLYYIWYYSWAGAELWFAGAVGDGDVFTCHAAWVWRDDVYVVIFRLFEYSFWIFSLNIVPIVPIVPIYFEYVAYLLWIFTLNIHFTLPIHFEYVAYSLWMLTIFTYNIHF